MDPFYSKFLTFLTLFVLVAIALPSIAQEKLEVEGGVKLGYSGSTDAGVMRWDSSSGELQCYVNTTLEWVSLTNPEPYVIGLTIDSTNARVSFNGSTGWQGANEMCRTAYPDYVDYVRALTVDEITRALVLDNIIDTIQIDGAQTWAISSSISGDPLKLQAIRGSSTNNALCLGTWTTDLSNAMIIEIDLNYTTGGNGGGVILDFMDVRTRDQNLHELRPLICGCYK